MAGTPPASDARPAVAVFRMLVYIEILDRRTSTIEGHTEEVVQDLPRIQFWKFSLGKRRGEPA